MLAGWIKPEEKGKVNSQLEVKNFLAQRSQLRLADCQVKLPKTLEVKGFQ